MKIKNTTLLIAIVTFITIQSSFADQLIINFDNPLPDTCNDVWFENGIEMELIKIDNSQNCNWFYFSESKINMIPAVSNGELPKLNFIIIKTWLLPSLQTIRHIIQSFSLLQITMI